MQGKEVSHGDTQTNKPPLRGSVQGKEVSHGDTQTNKPHLRGSVQGKEVSHGDTQTNKPHLRGSVQGKAVSHVDTQTNKPHNRGMQGKEVSRGVYTTISFILTKLDNIKNIDSIHLSTFIYYFTLKLWSIQFIVDCDGNQKYRNFETQL